MLIRGIIVSQSAWIGVLNDGGIFKVGMVNSITMDASWRTTNTGRTAATADVPKGTIYLRSTVNINPGSGRTGSFSYSTDGSNFTALGTAFTLTTDWYYFIGYRWGIFNYATKALGGSVTVNSFTQDVS
ncbi:putative xylosidase/glycosyl hydrolase [Hypoxylon sp. NC0597]|nr:putative xylosidase/glycosyl hydrolase [Hypoxylon sp. NC0597]